MHAFWPFRRRLRSVETAQQTAPELPGSDIQSSEAAPALSPHTALSYVVPSTAAQWLDALAQLEQVNAYKRLSFDLLGLRPNMDVLELGCGNGDDAHAIAERLDSNGSVTAVDIEPGIIEKAMARQHDDGGTKARIRFQVADAANLPFEDAAFDAVRIDRMLQHVDDPAIVMGEVARVLRPGGVAVVIEPDWKMMAVYPGSPNGGDDDHTVAAIFQWQVAHTAHPLMGRQLRAVLAGAGFEDIEAHPVAYATTRFAPVDLVLELSTAARAASHEDPPLLSADEVDRWIEAAQDADAAGTFFAIVPITFARALKASHT